MWFPKKAEPEDQNTIPMAGFVLGFNALQSEQIRVELRRHKPTMDE